MSESTEPASKDGASFCDLMKGNTSKIIQKVEGNLPLYFQMYSDIYKEYLHMFDDLMGTCYISEKEFFEKLNIDKRSLKLMENYWNEMTQFYSKQIDVSADILKLYSQSRISAIKSYDDYLHAVMETYARSLAQFNSYLRKTGS